MTAALLITGTVGSGKTSVADAVGDELARRETPHAVMDVDWLRRCWPTPPGDPFNGAITLKNLHAVAANFLAAGAERLVLAGVVESRAERNAYETALGVPLTVCRLRADPPTVRKRLTTRHEPYPGALAWHLNRSGELDRILDEARLEDATVDTTTATIDEAARAVLAAIGW